MVSQPPLNDEARRLLSQIYADLQRDGASNLVADAARLLVPEVDAELQASIANVAVHHHFHKGQFAQALVYCRKWLECDPDSRTASHSFLSVLTRLRRWSDVVAFAEEALKKHADDFSLRSALCQALGRLGRVEDAKIQGTLCLKLKDRSVGRETPERPKIVAPKFDHINRSKNVIAFSLFGNKDKYFKGAIENAIAARYIYPEWTCRFYIDETLPQEMYRRLTEEGAALARVQGLPSAKYGLFWRFLVAEDVKVERYLVRDCDAVVNIRERVAVEEWLDSGRNFHVMRDFYTHTELMLAGMWGGVSGALEPIGSMFCKYVEENVHHRTIDQEFLRSKIWPTVRASVLVHDSQFSFGEYREFPKLGRLPPGEHVGYARAL